MKKLIITAALAVASLGAIAGTVDVSSVTAKAVVNGTDVLGKAATLNVQLTDGERTCGRGTLEAVVTNGRGTTIACWRVIGDSVYLTKMLTISMGDVMVPLSAFEGDGATKLREATSEKVGATTTPVARESGPSGTYAGRVIAAIRPNITYPDADTVAGNPAAEFDVNLAPDGAIVGVKLRKSSGVPSWDEAAERAIRWTDKLPRDTNGRVYTPLVISLRPKD